MGRALSHVAPVGENHRMDGTAWIVAVGLAVIVIRALLPSVAPAMQAHVAALGQLLGGWRPPPWPRGLQEDDPETAWATHGRRQTTRIAVPDAASPETASIEDIQ
jgi:hypothetical protein